MDVFDVPENTIKLFEKQEVQSWRRLLRVGGRSAIDSVRILMGLKSCTLEWRVRRAGLFLRLLHSPPESWHHTALL
eukprot:4804221-Karenia_brevis.AAC.1